MAPAGAADPTFADLALLRHVAPELVDVLVVDLVDLRLAEEARLAAAGAARRRALSARRAVGFRCWDSLLLRTGCRRRRPGNRRRRPRRRLRARTGSRRRAPNGCRGTAQI